MRIRASWITLTAVACLAVFAPASASAESDPAEPTFVITGTTDSSVSIEWTDHSTNETGFKVEMRRADTDWTGVLDLRDHRAGQPQATGWTYAQTFNTALSPQVRAVCLRVKAYNDSGSSDWTRYLCTQPDLVVTGVSAPATIGHGVPFVVGYAACNFSNVTTERFSDQVGIFPREAGSVQRAGVAPDTCYFQNFPVSGLPAGTYTFSVSVDHLNQVNEAFENNNTGARIIRVT